MSPEPELLHTEVEGRPATVAWLDENFNVTTPEQATLAKIYFDDGEQMFAFVNKK